MHGFDYESIEDFKEACLYQREKLSPEDVLGRIYTADQLRYFSEKEDLNLIGFSTAGSGLKARYKLAKEIAKRLPIAKIGMLLSEIDHEHYFRIMSLRKLPKERPFDSIRNSIRHLSNQNISLKNNFKSLFNGITQPAGRNCKLESVKEEDDCLSFLFSCTRVLAIPESGGASYEDYFLARIPVLIRVLFNKSLLEISMPFFFEPLKVDSRSIINIPDRFQLIVESALLKFMKIFQYEFKPVNFRKFTMFLETEYSAEDYGWRIEPLTEAAFDLTQGVIPLKNILTKFSNSINRECERRKINHPIQQIDLYKLFRAIKEESYTYSMVLKAQLGKRKGDYIFSVLYGAPNSKYFPLIVINKNRESVAKNIWEAMADSQKMRYRNPYKLTKLLK